MPPALLAMEDGTVYRGFGFGAADSADVTGAGEIVFNTAITGYQEVLTDPSYRGQIVTMTAPEIGNVGINPTDFESSRPWCAGFVVRELSPVVSNWRASGSLHELLAAHGVAGITGIDTRAVTRRIRLSGAQRAVITRAVADPAAAVARARNHPSLEGRDLVREVTSASPYEWDEPLWEGPRAPIRGPVVVPPVRHHVVAYDYGIKRGILRHLRSSGCKVSVVPAATPAREALAMKPDGIFLSNGPGDPAAVDYAVEAARELCASKIPVFGICLGHQILGTRKVEITSQNHGFAVDVDSLAGKAELSHVSLNDKTVEGMRHATLPVFSVQYHPEASPGPNDAGYLFDRFRVSMEERRRR